MPTQPRSRSTRIFSILSETPSTCGDKLRPRATLRPFGLRSVAKQFPFGDLVELPTEVFTVESLLAQR